MHSTTRRNEISTLLCAATAGLMAFSAVSYTLGRSFQDFHSKAFGVRQIDWSSLSWVADLRFGLKPSVEVSAPEAFGPKAATAAQVLASSKPLRPRMRVVARPVKKALPASPLIAVTLELMRQEAPLAEAVIEVARGAEPDAQLAYLTMRAMHRSLRGAFQVAVNTQPKAPILAQKLDTQVQPVVEIQEIKAPAPLQAVPAPVVTAAAQPRVKPALTKASTSTLLSKSLPRLEVSAKVEAAAKQPVRLGPVARSVDRPKATKGLEPAPVQALEPVTPWIQQFAHTEKAAVVVSKTPIIIMPPKRAPLLDTQTEYPKAAKTQQVSSAVVAPAQPAEASREYSSPAARAKHRFVEALVWDSPISDTQVEQQSLGEDGWTRYEVRSMDSNPTHWPTLALSESAQVGPIPLLAKSAAYMVGKLSGYELRPSAGIVFGEIAPGWQVQFSGRSESLIAYDAQMKPIFSDVAQRMRYFVFLNAAPGAQVLYLKQSDSGRLAAVPLPVLGATATYLDLTRPTEQVFSGRVYDAGDSSAKGLSKVQVQLVGASTAVATTGKDGAFRVSGVWTFGAYPLYAETIARTGFKHRYRVRSDQLGDVRLFRFTATQVQDWVQQIAGGVSPESGFLVAALPRLAQGAAPAAGPYLASVRSMDSAPTLEPDTHALSPGGLLQGSVPLDPEMPRTIAVQIPEGFNQAVVRDAAGRTAWSELFPASPGVVNVLLSE